MCHGAAAWLNAEPGNGGDTSSTVVHPEEPFPGEVTYPYKGTLFRVACITAKQPECAREYVGGFSKFIYQLPISFTVNYS